MSYRFCWLTVFGLLKVGPQMLVNFPFFSNVDLSYHDIAVLIDTKPIIHHLSACSWFANIILL
jgi:hypothetical protein